jgi:ASC-1-like (ASCH) protein
MVAHTMNVCEPWFTHMRKGRKVVEVRLAKTSWAGVRPGDSLAIRNGAQTLLADVTSTALYPSDARALDMLAHLMAVGVTVWGMAAVFMGHANGDEALKTLCIMSMTVFAIILIHVILGVASMPLTANACLWRCLAQEGLDATLPGAGRIEEGVAVYRQWYTPEDVSRYGMIAIRIAVRPGTHIEGIPPLTA